MCTGTAVDGIPNADECKTDNKKTMITVLSDDFSAPSESNMRIFILR